MHFARGGGPLKKQLVSLSLEFTVPNTEISRIEEQIYGDLDRDELMVCITIDVQVSANDQLMPKPATMNIGDQLC